MMGFVFRLIPPRPTFALDMTQGERTMMAAHVAYWADLAKDGHALAFGPVADPAGPYGIGVVLADDQAGAEAIRDHDPALLANCGFHTEIAPMLRLVTPQGSFAADR